MSPPPADRTHSQCQRCRSQLDTAVAHCASHTCPWCRDCATKGTR